MQARLFKGLICLKDPLVLFVVRVRLGDGVVLVRMPMYTALHEAVRETAPILRSLRHKQSGKKCKSQHTKEHAQHAPIGTRKI